MSFSPRKTVLAAATVLAAFVPASAALAQAPAPNLSVRDIEFEYGGTPAAKIPTKVRIDVKNTGDAKARASYLSYKTTPTARAQVGRVPALTPGSSAVTEIKVRFADAGPRITETRLDVYKQVAESNEDDNFFERYVDVNPTPRANVDVDVPYLRVLNDLDDDVLNYDGEWAPTILTVFDPTTSCNLDVSVGPLSIQRTIPAVGCSVNGDTEVNDEDDVYAHPNVGVRTHLIPGQPVIANLSVFEDDSPLTPDVPGTASFYHAFPAAGLPGTFEVAGKGCTKTGVTGEPYAVDGGHCFDAAFSVAERVGVAKAATPGEALAAQGTASAEAERLDKTMASVQADIRRLSAKARAQDPNAQLEVTAR